MTIIELVQELYGTTNAAIAASMAQASGLAGAKDVYMAWGKEQGHPVKHLNEEWAACAPKKTGGAKGFAEQYYDWLAEESRSEQDAHDYIMGDESQNVRNHLTHYLNIWALAESVRSGVRVQRTITAGKTAPKAKAKDKKEQEQPKDTWEYNDSDPFADVRSAWENLKRETARAKPRKTRLHSDKVAKFSDEELTAAYNKAFQTYCK